MNTTMIKQTAKDIAAQKFFDHFPDALAVLDKNYTYLIPIEVEDEQGVKHTVYAQFGLTTKDTKATKTREEFVVEDRCAPARDAWENMINERAENERAKAAAKAAKSKK